MNTSSTSRTCCLDWRSLLPASPPAAAPLQAVPLQAVPLQAVAAPPPRQRAGAPAPLFSLGGRVGLDSAGMVFERRVGRLELMSARFVQCSIAAQGEMLFLAHAPAAVPDMEERLTIMLRSFDEQCNIYRNVHSMLRAQPSLRADPDVQQYLAALNIGLPVGLELLHTCVAPSIEKLRLTDVPAAERMQELLQGVLHHGQLASAC